MLVNEEYFCSGGAGGYQVGVVQASVCINGRTVSALYLALPKRLLRHPLPRLTAAKRSIHIIEVFRYSP
jgi:hypothetical protein